MRLRWGQVDLEDANHVRVGDRIVAALQGQDSVAAELFELVYGQITVRDSPTRARVISFLPCGGAADMGVPDEETVNTERVDLDVPLRRGQDPPLVVEARHRLEPLVCNQVLPYFCRHLVERLIFDDDARRRIELEHAKWGLRAHQEFAASQHLAALRVRLGVFARHCQVDLPLDDDVYCRTVKR